MSLLPQWRTSLCELGERGDDGGPLAISGGFISDFKSNITLPKLYDSSRSDYATAYLLLNVSKGGSEKWAAFTEKRLPEPPGPQRNGEWVDLVYSDDGLVLSATLCYAAFETADIPVEVTSTQNRTKPEPAWVAKDGVFTFADYRKLLGQDDSVTSFEQRQNLQLLGKQRLYIFCDCEMST